MITKECLDTVLPVVADDWDSLRKCDVYRLVNSIAFDHADSVREAGNLIAKQREDLRDEVQEVVSEVIEDLFGAVAG